MNQPNVPVSAKDQTVEVTVEELWEELRSLGVDKAVRELINREAQTHNAVLERIVTAAGFRRHPGVDALCNTLKNRRQAGMTVATLAEGLSGEVTGLRRVIDNAKGVLNPEGATTLAAAKGQLEKAARVLAGIHNVTNAANLDTVSSRVDHYRRLVGSSVPSSEVSA